MSKWRYTARDRNHNQLGEGTVQAGDYWEAHTEASKDARGKDVPFYDLVVFEKKEDN